jgi:uncharacterized membrane protein YqjE
MADDTDEGTAEPASGETPEGEKPSLLSDVEALVADGKTYAEAELAFQKTRLLYASDKVKSAAIFTGIAAVFVVMAIVALVLGAVLALTPLIGPLGATAAVFLALLVCAGVLVLMAKSRITDLIRAFEEPDEQA